VLLLNNYLHSTLQSRQSIKQRRSITPETDPKPTYGNNKKLLPLQIQQQERRTVTKNTRNNANQQHQTSTYYPTRSTAKKQLSNINKHQ